MVTMAHRQCGLSLSGMLMTAVVLVLLAIIGMKAIPPYMEEKTIQSQFDELAHDPDLKGASKNDIRIAFSRRATVSDISSIKAEDIKIEQNGDAITLSASYSVKVPLFANASLLLEFSPSSK